MRSPSTTGASPAVNAAIGATEEPANTLGAIRKIATSLSGFDASTTARTFRCSSNWTEFNCDRLTTCSFVITRPASSTMKPVPRPVSDQTVTTEFFNLLNCDVSSSTTCAGGWVGGATDVVA